MPTDTETVNIMKDGYNKHRDALQGQKILRPTREKILKDMYNGVVSFTFKKKDGEEREMNATLVIRFIPEEKLPDNDKNHTKDPKSDLICCFDVDKNDWRSFHVSSLVEYKGLVKRAI